MFSKEEDLKKIDSAYPKIVISTGEYETEGFTKILSKESSDDRRTCIAEYIKNYQGDSLFVNY